MVEVLTKEQLLKYALPIIHQFIIKYASECPAEHKEEIVQETYYRLLKHFDKIDPELGWKSFCFNHTRGTVLDYLKGGVGFKEQSWSISKEEKTDSRNRLKIRERLSMPAESPDDFDIDHALGAAGIFSTIVGQEIEINWDLVSRMSIHDEAIHATAKWIRGFQIKEIAKFLGVSKSKTIQLIKIFVARFDDPELYDDVWFLQTAYAFGLLGHLGLKKVDQSDVCGFPIGWNLPRLNLDSEGEFDISAEFQMSFFDVG